LIDQTWFSMMTNRNENKEKLNEKILKPNITNPVHKRI